MGKYRFRRMPFGLCNAPAEFQRLMDRVLEDIQSAEAYIDNVVVTSQSWEEHLDHLQAVFTRLKEAGLTVKRTKCVFAGPEVRFLGHTIGAGKVMPQDTKVKAIREFRQPVTKADLRAFLRLVGYYRRFIPRFAQRSARLIDATSKHCPDRVEWTEEMVEEFKQLKEALGDSTELNIFDPNRTTILHTDASDRGLGAVLLQEDAEGQERPVVFYSKKLLPRQRNYSVSEKLLCLGEGMPRCSRGY